MTHYYEELAPGVVVETASRTIGDDDIAAEVRRSADLGVPGEKVVP